MSKKQNKKECQYCCWLFYCEKATRGSNKSGVIWYLSLFNAGLKGGTCGLFMPKNGGILWMDSTVCNSCVKKDSLNIWSYLLFSEGGFWTSVGCERWPGLVFLKISWYWHYSGDMLFSLFWCIIQQKSCNSSQYFYFMTEGQVSSLSSTKKHWTGPSTINLLQTVSGHINDPWQDKIPSSWILI